MILNTIAALIIISFVALIFYILAHSPYHLMLVGTIVALFLGVTILSWAFSRIFDP